MLIGVLSGLVRPNLGFRSVAAEHAIAIQPEGGGTLPAMSLLTSA